MFGNHQKHDILSLKEGANFLRDCIHAQLKKGIPHILPKFNFRNFKKGIYRDSTFRNS